MANLSENLTLKERLKQASSLFFKAGTNVGIILVLLAIGAISNPTKLFIAKARPTAVNTPVFGSSALTGKTILHDAYLTSQPTLLVKQNFNNPYWGVYDFISAKGTNTSKNLIALNTDNKTTWTLGDEGESQLRIDLKSIAGTDDVSILVNNKEVIRLREATLEGVSPMDQALVFATNLSRFISNQGHAQDIKLAEEANDAKTTIMAGSTELITVDNNTAKTVNGRHRSIAFTWSNQIRKALGAGRYIDPILAESGDSQFEEVDPKELVSTGSILEGGASWYGPNFHGKHTASGAIFDMNKLTAAHKTLPFGTMVKVTFKKTGKSAIVRITDRGPYAHGRIIDLSKAAAKQIGLMGSGTGVVKIEVLGKATDIIAQQKQPVAEGLQTNATTTPIPVSDPNTGGKRLKEAAPNIKIKTEALTKNAEKQSSTTTQQTTEEQIERVQQHHSFLGHPPEESVEVYRPAPKNPPAEASNDETKPLS